MRFSTRPRVESPDLIGQVVGLCVVESKAPSVSNRTRWRIRCRALTPEGTCGELFYLETAQVHTYQKPGHELFCCTPCRKRRRAAASLVRFTCEGCSAPVEMPRAKQRARSEQTQRMCKFCAIRAGRTYAEGARATRRAERKAANG